MHCYVFISNEYLSCDFLVTSLYVQQYLFLDDKNEFLYLVLECKVMLCLVHTHLVYICVPIEQFQAIVNKVMFHQLKTRCPTICHIASHVNTSIDNPLLNNIVQSLCISLLLKWPRNSYKCSHLLLQVFNTMFWCHDLLINWYTVAVTL